MRKHTSQQSIRIGKYHAQGFTLVEALVATAVFVIVITIALDIILFFIKIPLDGNLGEGVQQDLNYVLEQFAYSQRNAEIDYNRYTSDPACGGPLVVGTAVTALCTIDNASSSIAQLGTHPITGANEMLYIDDGSVPQPMTGNDIIITDLQFYIYPAANPFDVTTGMHNEPAIVMVVSAQSIDDDSHNYIYQTMVTTRLYER